MGHISHLPTDSCAVSLPRHTQSRLAGDKSADDKRSRQTHSSSGSDLPGLHVLSGLCLHRDASPGMPTVGLTPCLLTVGRSQQLPTCPEPFQKRRFPVIIQEQWGGAEASTEEAFCTLHSTTYQSYSRQLHVPGSLAPGQRYLFLEQAFFGGRGISYTPGRPQTPNPPAAISQMLGLQACSTTPG